MIFRERKRRGNVMVERRGSKERERKALLWWSEEVAKRGRGKHCCGGERMRNIFPGLKNYFLNFNLYKFKTY